MQIRFWGVRGSTPTPEPRNTRYGGNTCCLEVRLANGAIIIFDCGSGLRALGKRLQNEFGKRPIQASLFLTHFHWDHIQGIPFFVPLYHRGNQFKFYSVLRTGSDLKDTIEGQMVNPYFPVNMNVMGAQRHFSSLEETPFSLHGATIRSALLNHPQGCVGYRIEADNGIFVLATDNEPGSPVHDKALRELAEGADVLVCDAQYSPEQLAGDKRGWGHSSWLEGVRIAKECHVKNLVLFHHDPDSDDAQVDAYVADAQKEFANTWGANEGMTISLPQGVFSHPMQIGGRERRTSPRYHVELPVHVAWKDAKGKRHKAEGLARNVSMSGIFFVVPQAIETHDPVQVELVLPDEITHRGEVRVKFTARTVRQEIVGDGLRAETRGVAVAAELETRDAGEPLPKKARPRKKK